VAAAAPGSDEVATNRRIIHVAKPSEEATPEIATGTARAALERYSISILCFSADGAEHQLIVYEKASSKAGSGD
jgi:hypothetical protein